jgi:excisionase family DNA binding protein
MRLVDATLDDVQAIVRRELGQFQDTRKPTSNKKEWLSNSEVMSLLQVSRSTLSRHRASGKLPFSKVGSCVWYRRQDVEQMLSQGLKVRVSPEAIR